MRIWAAAMMCVALVGCRGKKGEPPRFEAELPVMAEGLYELPRSSATKAIEAAFYVVVTADAVGTAAMPRGTPVVGGPFPGELVATEEVPDRLEAYRAVISRARRENADPVEAWREALAQGASPPPVKATEEAPPEEDDSEDEIYTESAEDDSEQPQGLGTTTNLDEGKMGKPDTGRYDMQTTGPIDPQRARAEQMEKMRNPPPSRWSVSPDAPLLLADASLPASRLFQVVSMMCADGVRLGVADSSGARAVEHRVALGQLGADRCLGWAAHDASIKETRDRRKRGHTTLAHKPHPFGLVISADGFVIVDLDHKTKPLMSARAADRTVLAAALKEVIGDRADEYQLWLRAERDATVAAVVAALDGASEVFQTALVDTTEEDWRTNHLGDYDRGEWQKARAAIYRPQLDLRFLRKVGDLPSTEISRYLRRKEPVLRACYARALAESPQLAGKLSIRFYITPTGAVVNCRVQGLADDNADFAVDVADVISSVLFPKPTGGGLAQVWAVYEATPTLQPRY